MILWFLNCFSDCANSDGCWDEYRDRYYAYYNFEGSISHAWLFMENTSVDQNTKQIRAIDSGLEKFALNGLGGKFMEWK